VSVVPDKKKYPALAVVKGDGTVVYAQGDEFSTMRNLEPSAVTEFLNKRKR
jgi:hypothetical protein